MTLEAIKTRMLDIAKRRGLMHLSSCCSCLPILHGIYERAEPNDVIILSCGHAGLALYCCLEAFRGQDAEALHDRFGTHPKYDPAAGIFCSTGSLGCGLAIAAGYALAGRTTHVVISDGECDEGIVWETLAFLGTKRLSITVYVNANGFSAYRSVNRNRLQIRLQAFMPSVVFVHTSNEPFLPSIAAHYQKQ